MTPTQPTHTTTEVSEAMVERAVSAALGADIIPIEGGGEGVRIADYLEFPSPGDVVELGVSLGIGDDGKPRIRSALVATPPAPTAAVDGEVMKALREALEYVRGIIVEGSLTGFNPLDGDWAERLYASQGLTHRALAALKAPAPEAVAPTGTVISDAMVERALNAYYGGDGGAIGHLRTDMRVALAAALSAPMGEGEALTIEAYYARQIDWSRNTFGPALRTRGVIDHIRKELAEIEADPHDLSEWVDVVILAMDGFWRHGGAVKDLMPRLLAKQQKNMARTWPDWRLMSEDTAIEHDRSGEGVRP